jgi:hypothetical protein
MQVFNPNDPNVAMLEHVARSLGPELCSQLVFVGGAAEGLLITDLAMPPIRRTDDVDIVTNAEALADYYRFEDQFRDLGFVQDQSPDMGDIISVIDGRASLLNECQESLAPLRAYLAAQFQHLLTDRRFVDALPGHLPPDGASQARLPDLLIKIQHISELAVS